MKPIQMEEITDYVEQNVETFHQKRLERIANLQLKTILKRKNPYLFKAKNILTSQDLAKTLVDAHLSSQEETIFGDFLENLSVFINGKVYNGIKSSTEGIDLEFDNNQIRYIVSIKSGPNWANSSQLKKMKDNFKKAKRILRTGNSKLHVIAVNGCCYGIDNKPDKGDYYKYCGQRFWEFISGERELYTQIIKPLGHRSKQKNEIFYQEYSKIINNFTLEFGENFCVDGQIDWKALVKFNSIDSHPSYHQQSKL